VLKAAGHGIQGSVALGPDDLVLCSGTLPRDTSFVDRIDAAEAGGFSGISMWGRDYGAARREGHSDADMRARLADHGLAVAELDPAWWWTPLEVDVASLVAIDDMEVFRYGERELFDIADAVGARSINAVDALMRTIPGAKIVGVQLDDAPNQPEPNPMIATLHERLLPGDGELDLGSLISALRDVGAVAPIGVEVFSDALHALGPHEAARRAGTAARRLLGPEPAVRS
jgi:sugar phosphate isomerase/epimerase